MQAKSFLKIWLCSQDQNFEKFTSLMRPITAERLRALLLVARRVYRSEFLNINAQQQDVH